MYKDQSNVDVSTARRQRLELCSSTASSSQTLSASRHRFWTVALLIKDHYAIDDLDEYINKTLALKFSELTINDLAPVSYV